MTTTSTVTVLFTDVVGSTGFKTSRGDAAAEDIMRVHSKVVRQQIERHSGLEVKTVGDSFMVAYASARKAVECAVAVQRALEEDNRRHPAEQVHIRIGLNTGEAIWEGDDLFGAAVVAAKRIESKAAGGQILVSEMVRGVIGTAADLQFMDRGRFQLKGFPEPWRLYEVPWQAEAAESAAVVLSLLFTDIVGFFTITETLAEQAWLGLLRAHNAIIRSQLSAQGAFWFKSMGDGFIAAFHTPDAAVQCAIAIQRGIAAYNIEHPGEPLPVRTGLHTGEAIQEADDFYGRAVNLVVRLGGQAEGRQILASGVVRQLTAGGPFLFSDRGDAVIRGAQDPVRLYEVRWREEG